MSPPSDAHAPTTPTTPDGVGEIEVLNLADGGVIRTGGQPVLNVVGRLHDPDQALTYRLNEGPERPVAVQGADGRAGPRLARPGEFNIDTIVDADLRDHNRLWLRTGGNEPTVRTLSFTRVACPRAPDGVATDLDGATTVADVGQVVDGAWRITRDADGSHLAVAPEDAGYDRVVLLAVGDGRDVVVEMSLTVDAWTSASHGVGFVFGWGGHPCGDGQRLPQTWTTGLAYYTSKGRGVALRVGRDVEYTEDGGPVGSHVLAERPLTSGRHLVQRAGRRVGMAPGRWSQLPVGQPHQFRFEVIGRTVSLTVWRHGRRRPAPLLGAELDADALQGGIGVFLHNAAARVHDFRAGPP